MGYGYPAQNPWSNLSQTGANNYGLVRPGQNAWLNQNSTGGWQSRIDSFGRNTGGLQTGGHNLIANSYNGGNTWFDQSNANQQFANIYGGNFNVTKATATSVKATSTVDKATSIPTTSTILMLGLQAARLIPTKTVASMRVHF
jgi:hypothetical protein